MEEPLLPDILAPEKGPGKDDGAKDAEQGALVAQGPDGSEGSEEGEEFVRSWRPLGRLSSLLEAVKDDDAGALQRMAESSKVPNAHLKRAPQQVIARAVSAKVGLKGL